MAEVENHFTVFVRLPFNRGDFIDPPPVAWSAAKERALWDVISRQGQGKGNEIDWNTLAAQFDVTQPFLLQQAAWLYERQLSQVRAQLKKVGNRQSATQSPAPGSVTSSVVGAQAMRRVGSGGSRAPSRLSTQHLGSPSLVPEGSGSPVPGRSRTSLPLRVPPAVAAAAAAPPQPRAPSGSARPLSRQASKEVEPQHQTLPRQPNPAHHTLRSPGPTKPTAQESDSEDGDEQMTKSKYMTRRANPSSLHRRSASLRKDRAAQAQRADVADADVDEDDDNDDTASFLPFAADAPGQLSRQNTPSTQDPSATLRGGLADATPPRPKTHRRSTSERITSPTSAQTPTATTAKLHSMSASTSSVSSNSGTGQPPGAGQPTQPPVSNRSARTLSPRQQATLASAGLSPRRQGSESSPSMGSSFSDLDDASVTQSALEEALMSGMGNTTHTVASRVSGLSHALRSRYFDARQNER